MGLGGTKSTQRGGHAATILLECSQLGAKSQLDLRICDGVVMKHGLKSVLGSHANVRGTMRPRHIAPGRFNSANLAPSKRFDPDEAKCPRG